MTDEKKPPQGTVKGGQRKKLTQSQQQTLERLDARKIAPDLVVDDRQRLAWGLLCEGADKLKFSANKSHRDAGRLKGPSHTDAHIYVLRHRVASVVQLINDLEAVLRYPVDSIQIPPVH